MDFENERYVRLYTRETTTWRLLSWEAQALLPQVLRLVDRAGVLDLAGVEPHVAMSAHLPAWPEDVVRKGLQSLEHREVIEVSGGQIVWPKYLEAQECRKSDAQRKRDERERRRDSARVSQPVTPGHAASHDVTPTLTIPNQTNPTQELMSRAKASRPTPSEPNSAPSEPDDVASVLDAIAQARRRLGRQTQRRNASKTTIRQVRRPFGGRKLSAHEVASWLTAIRHAEEFCRRNPTTRDGADMAGMVLTLGNLSQPDKLSKWLERDDLDEPAPADPKRHIGHHTVTADKKYDPPGEVKL